MNIIYPSRHVRHIPPHEIFNGNRDAHEDVPERIENIKESLERIESLRFVLPTRFPRSWIEEVHDIPYINHLAEAGRLAGSQYVYPSVFPYGAGQHTEQEVGIRGQYCFDTYTPVNATTYEAAHGSAMAALTAASLVRRGERASYALCRPPGHHAEHARMGGYCYFNNAAIAANYLSRRGRVAILDIDVHHGNGTQDIFYSRSDVIFVSIHGDPDSLYPYFSGRVDETGLGDGIGFTSNFPLPLGSVDAAYDIALTAAIARVRESQVNYLVVSLGFDAHRDDPIGRLRLSTEYYSRIARTIAGLHIPTVFVQEGGYNIDTIGTLAQTFIGGFLRGGDYRE